jgi:DNA-binding phage protein
VTERFLRWDPADHLQSEQDVTMYLAACLAEDPGDGRVVRAGLDDIGRAQDAVQLAARNGNRI